MTTHGLVKNFLLIVAVSIISCKKDSHKRFVSEIKSNKSEVTLLAEGGRDSILITSTERWKIKKTVNSEWFQLSKDSGEAGITIVYIDAQPNVSNAGRVSDITINSLEETLTPVSVKIKQSHDLKISYFLNRSAPGEATIEIYGKGFSEISAENIVTINGLKAIVQSASNINLKVTVPSKAGSGPIIISVGNISDTSDIDFIYEWVGEVEVVAGGSDGYADGPVASAKFSRPEGISFDNDNNLYVADYNNSKIRKVTPSGVVTTIPGRIPSWSNPSGPNTDYALPTATAVMDNGEILVVEFNSSVVTKYIPPNSVDIFAGGYSSELKNGNGTAATFYRPIDIAIDSYGNMYIADKDNLCIRKITPNADVTTFAGGQWGYEDGAGELARFNRPMGISIDPQDNLYVTDYYNNRIRKITPNRIVTTIAGTGSHGSMDGQALTEATFTNPKAITVASDGVIYVSEANGDNKIRLIKPNGRVESIVSFKEAQSGAVFNFNYIAGLAIDKNGILYASDYYNSRICKITYK